MRSFLSIFLSVILLLPQLGNMWVIIDFKIHQDYIRKELCVQKDKPVNTCNGKCHLNKELSKQAEEPAKEAPRAAGKYFELVFVQQRDPVQKGVRNELRDDKRQSTHDDRLPKDHFTGRIFKPPKTV